MKKLLLTMLGVAGMLCSTSCSDEEIVSSVQGDAMVQFTVELSDGSDASRAISDGTTVNTVYYEVWGTKNNQYQIISDLKDTAVIADKKATVNLALVKGQTYDIVFWASKAGVYNTSDLTNIAVNEGKTNDETKDAFTAKRTYTVNGPIKETVILRRPFAQINFGTPQSDLNAAEAAGAVIAQSELTVTNVATTYNALTEMGVGEKNYTFGINAIADTVAEDLVVNGAKYEYLATAYVLYQGDSTATATSDLTMRVPTGLNQDIVLTVPTAPVQRNYRTNILGNLLTNQAVFEVVVDPIYKGDYPNTKEQELRFAAATGGTVTLTENVTLTEPLNVTADNLVINLGGYKISNANGYAIENTGNLTINGDANGGISGLGGIRSNGGKITIAGGTYTAASNWSSGTYQHVLKAENTEVVINGGVFDATIGGTNNAMINVSTGSTVTINGGEFKNVEGIIPAFAPYMFTYENDGKLIINDGTFYGGWRFNGTTSTTDIYGGDFTVSYDGQSFHANSTHVLTIYGGTFSLNNGGKLNPANYVAEGYAATDNGNGTWTVAQKITSANIVEVLNNLSTSEPTTLVLSEDITSNESVTIPEGADVTINLNSKNIASITSDAFVVNKGATLTISGSGKVEANGAPIRAIGGKVIVEGGEFTQTGAWNTAVPTYRYSVDSREGGEIIIKGGTFKSNNGMINVNANSSLVIDGGNFEFDNNTKGTRHFAYVSGKLTINNGEFKGVADAGAGGCFFCGAAAGCEIQINDGKFTSLWTSGSANKIFEVYYGGSINITGGLFNTNGGIASFVEANTDDATKDAYPYKAK